MADLSPREQAFAKVDLMTAELEMTASIYDGFSTAIVVKGHPRTVGLFREFDDAVQVMALIAHAREQSKALARPSEPHPRIADLIGANDRAHDRKVRLSAALIKVVEHFERIDAPEADRRAIHSACQTWAGVKAEDLLDGRSAADPYALQKAIANLRHSIADEIPFGLTYVNSDDLAVVMDAVELATPARAEALDEGVAGEEDTFYGKDCPVGMVQVKFVGCPPSERYSAYGWKPTQSAFIELYVDGHHYRIDAGNIGQNCFDGKPRRGIHINYPMGSELGDLSMNALNLSVPDSAPFWSPSHPSPPPAADEDRVRIAVEEMADAVDFFDRVKASSQTEQIAVGRDHWNRLEAAARAVAALRSEGKLPAPQTFDGTLPAALNGYKLGDEVRMTEPCHSGVYPDDDSEEEQRTSQPGARGRIDSIAFLGDRQGWSVTVEILDGPGEGVVNVFDELDPSFPFEPWVSGAHMADEDELLTQRALQRDRETYDGEGD